MNSTNQSEIATFLIKAKGAINNNCFDFVPRRKNLTSLAAVGLTITDAKAEILSLSTNNYYKGPEDDLDLNREGKIWIFKKEINHCIFYIKLKIIEINDKVILKCLSFHIDE